MNCEICNGELEFIGQLGNLLWFRCRACGMQFSKSERILNSSCFSLDDYIQDRKETLK